MATKQKTQTQKNDSGVPEGSVDDVKKWVGDDPDRAKAALAAEREKSEDDQRETLIEPLENMLGSDSDSDSDSDADAPRFETTVSTSAAEASKDDPAPIASRVTMADQSGDDTVLLEEELIALSLPRRGARILKTIAGAKGHRISKARKEEIEKRNKEVEEEAAERAKVMDPAESDDEE